MTIRPILGTPRSDFWVGEVSGAPNGNIPAAFALPPNESRDGRLVFVEPPMVGDSENETLVLIDGQDTEFLFAADNPGLITNQ